MNQPSLRDNKSDVGTDSFADPGAEALAPPGVLETLRKEALSIISCYQVGVAS